MGALLRSVRRKRQQVLPAHAGRARVVRTRAERARALLQGGRLSATDTALDVGYGHTGNVGTAFKRRDGMGPIACRKRARP
jgi:AraC-like DNA-binding protein